MLENNSFKTLKTARLSLIHILNIGKASLVKYAP